MNAPDTFNFEQVIDRRHGDSQKWNKYSGRDVLPMWVADMDFATPPAIQKALAQRIQSSCIGYAKPGESLISATLDYLQQQYAWTIQPEWLLWLPGLVPGINLSCRAVAGDVLSAVPIYPPFLSAPGFAGKKLVRSELHIDQGRWCFDFVGMEEAMHKALKENGQKPRLLLFCHPHNPVGRAWQPDELFELSAFCQRHDLVVCSDEIHCDLILKAGHRHQPLAMLDDYMSERCITLMAPSKTYNIPGLGCSFAVISNAKLRQAFAQQMQGIMPDVNTLGLVAAESALRDCADWHSALLNTLRSNGACVESVVKTLPKLSMMPVEATYLAWIDARGLDVADPAAFFEAAGLGLSSGADFGAPGWVRLNFGCPRSTLDSALERLMLACSA